MEKEISCSKPPTITFNCGCNQQTRARRLAEMDTSKTCRLIFWDTDPFHGDETWRAEKSSIKDFPT